MAPIRQDRSLLEAALIGLQLQLEQIEKQMADVRRQIAGRDGAWQMGSAPVRKGRTMSPAARERIAAAQRKRWAAVRKRQRKGV